MGRVVVGHGKQKIVNKKRSRMKAKRTGDREFFVISKTWKIDCDNLNFILKRKGQSEDGEESKAWKIMGFYPTVKELYHKLVEMGIKESSLTEIKALDIKIQELHQHIDNAKGIMSEEK